MSNIVLNSKTYTGEPGSRPATWVERSLGLFAGFSFLTGRVTSASKKIIVKWNLAIPTLVPADSPCGCAGQVKYTTYATVEVRFPPSITAAERTDVKARLQSLMTNAIVTDSIESLVIASP